MHVGDFGGKSAQCARPHAKIVIVVRCGFAPWHEMQLWHRQRVQGYGGRDEHQVVIGCGQAAKTTSCESSTPITGRFAKP